MTTFKVDEERKLNYNYFYNEAINLINHDFNNFSLQLKHFDCLMDLINTHLELQKQLNEFFDKQNVNYKAQETLMGRTKYKKVYTTKDYSSLTLGEFIRILDYYNMPRTKEVCNLRNDKRLIFKVVNYDLFKETLNNRKKQVILERYLRQVYFNDELQSKLKPIKVILKYYSVEMKIDYVMKVDQIDYIYMRIIKITH